MMARYPEIRERLKVAARALSDTDLQERLWRLGQRRDDSELGFDDTLLVFVDELDMFGRGDLVGNVLLNEREQRYLDEVQDAVRSLIDTIGAQGTYGQAAASGAVWDRCTTAAAELDRQFSLDGDPE